MRELRLLAREWPGNHSRFGMRAALRCLAGDRRLRRSRSEVEETGIEGLTFSVVPGLTVFWRQVNAETMNGLLDRMIVGDCSGGLRPKHFGGGPCSPGVLPCLNRKHGEKLDLFLRHGVNGKLILICDDDVYFLTRKPLEWAIRKVREDGAIAASIRPRSQTSTLMARYTDRPMGSACVLIDRQRWLEQNLSFAVRAGDRADADWFYDTGDWAHRQSVERGERIATIPPELDVDVVSPRAMSTWLLKFHKHPFEQLGDVANNEFRRRKARRAFLVAEEIQKRGTRGKGALSLLPRGACQSLASATRLLLSDAENCQIDQEIRDLFERLDSATSPHTLANV